MARGLGDKEQERKECAGSGPRLAQGAVFMASGATSRGLGCGCVGTSGARARLRWAQQAGAAEGQAAGNPQPDSSS